MAYLKRSIHLILLCMGIVLFPACDKAPEPGQTPAMLHPAERAFLEARLQRTVELLDAERRDAADGLLLTYALFLLGDDSRSRSLFEKVMSGARSEQSPMFYALGFLLTGKPEQALMQLEKARHQGPQMFFAQMLFIETLVLNRQFDKADAELARFVHQYPDENIVYHTQGHLYSAWQLWEKAIAAYEEARKRGGENPDLDEGIAAALIALGRYREAQSVVERCKVDFPDYDEILFEEIRLMHQKPAVSEEALRSLVSEFKKRSRRTDRFSEVDAWPR